MQKMPNITLKQAGEYIANRLPFRASNLSGYQIVDINTGKVYGYWVFSYATKIYAEENGEIIINRLDERFSRSTSRHQRIVKNALDID